MVTLKIRGLTLIIHLLLVVISCHETQGITSSKGIKDYKLCISENRNRLVGYLVRRLIEMSVLDILLASGLRW